MPNFIEIFAKLNTLAEPYNEVSQEWNDIDLCIHSLKGISRKLTDHPQATEVVCDIVDRLIDLDREPALSPLATRSLPDLLKYEFAHLKEIIDKLEKQKSLDAEQEGIINKIYELTRFPTIKKCARPDLEVEIPAPQSNNEFENLLEFSFISAKLEDISPQNIETVPSLQISSCLTHLEAIKNQLAHHQQAIEVVLNILVKLIDPNREPEPIGMATRNLSRSEVLMHEFKDLERIIIELGKRHYLDVNKEIIINEIYELTHYPTIRLSTKPDLEMANPEDFAPRPDDTFPELLGMFSRDFLNQESTANSSVVSTNLIVTEQPPQPIPQNHPAPGAPGKDGGNG
jgi:hypothetical protein